MRDEAHAVQGLVVAQRNGEALALCTANLAALFLNVGRRPLAAAADH